MSETLRFVKSVVRGLTSEQDPDIATRRVDLTLIPEILLTVICDHAMGSKNKKPDSTGGVNADVMEMIWHK